MDSSPPGSAIHGIFQARILEWAAISFSRGSSRPRDRTRVFCIADRRFYHLSHQGSPLTKVHRAKWDMEAPKTAFQSSSTGWSWGGVGWGGREWVSLLDKNCFSFSPSSFPETITEDPAGLEWGEGEEGSLDECPGRYCPQTGSSGSLTAFSPGRQEGIGSQFQGERGLLSFSWSSPTPTFPQLCRGPNYILWPCSHLYPDL